MSLRRVSVSFDAMRSFVLHDVSLTMTRGERWVVLGANGSGKTTLVQLVTGYLHPSRGDLVLLGARLGSGVDWRKLRERVSVVSAAFAKMVRPDLPAVDIVMTAKNAALEPWWHSYDDADRDRARGLLAAAGFGHLADRPFGTLSEGERQQVQLARTLMRPPEMIVLDEPAAGLDLGARERLMARMAQIAGDPALPGALLVTHHLEEIPPGFTHALLLRSGRAVASGPIVDTVTSENVSIAFDLSVSVSYESGRFAASFR